MAEDDADACPGLDKDLVLLRLFGARSSGALPVLNPGSVVHYTRRLLVTEPSLRQTLNLRSKMMELNTNSEALGLP